MNHTNEPALPVCEHLAAHGAQQPFAILALDAQTGAALCPSCTTTEAGALLDVLPPAEISAALRFDACGHPLTAGGYCLRCLTGVTGALQVRWAELAFTADTSANRLGKLLRILAHKYDRAVVGAGQQPQGSTTGRGVYSPRMLRSESLNGDRARAAVKWEEGRAQRQRTLRAPVQAIAVVSPAQRTAVA